jgi:TonB family protein
MKAVHYLGISLAVHAGLAVMFLLLRAPQPLQSEEIRVILEFSPLDRDRVLSRESLPSREAAGRPNQEIGQRGVPVPVFDSGGAIAAPAPGPAEGLRVEERSERMPTVQPRLPAPAPAAPEVVLPEAADVLDRVLSRVKASPDGPPDRNRPVGETELVWRGAGRRLLQQGALSFPEILVREGQEVDVEAGFLVSPDGRVTEIEITRSSGYILVDRAIERALLEYLFEGSATGETEAGLIRFRFRLEIPD